MSKNLKLTAKTNQKYKLKETEEYIEIPFVALSENTVFRPLINYEPTDATGAIIGLQATHSTEMLEHNQSFALPDLKDYADDQEAPVFDLSLAFAQNFGINMPNIQVDFSPYAGVRTLVHTALILLTSLNGMFIVWGELKKQ